jgi:hypothetical protein
VRVVAIGGRATIGFGSGFGVAAVFAPTLAIFSSLKISNDFSTNLGKAGGAKQPSPK